MASRTSLLWTSGIICFVYLFFAFYFYPYRIYGDAAYYLFKIVNFVGFNIEHGRPVGYFTQVLPVWLASAGVKLDYIIMSYSLNEWLYFTVCSVFCLVYYRSPQATLGIWLILLFGSRWNYFNHVSELILASPLFLFLILEFRKRSDSIVRTIAIGILAYFVLSSHALFVFPVLFFIVFEYLYKRELTKPLLLQSAVLLILVVIKYVTLGRYESNPLANVANPEMTGWSMIAKFSYVEFLFANSIYYPGMLFLVAVTSYEMCRRRSWLQLSVYFTAIIGYTFLVIFLYGRFFHGAYEPFERYLFIVPLVVCMVFVLYYPDLLRKRVLYGLLLVFVGVQFINLFSYGQKAIKRFDQLDFALQNGMQFSESKLLYRVGHINKKHPWQDWIYNIESILLSARNNPLNCRQVIIEEAFRKADLRQIGNDEIVELADPFSTLKIDDLNKDYFPLTAGPIYDCNQEEPLDAELESCIGHSTIKIGGKLDWSHSEEYPLLVEIRNSCSRTIPARLSGKSFYLSYHLYNKDSCYLWDGDRMPLYSNVKDYVRQVITVQAPAEPGVYTIVVDLMIEGEKWFGIDASREVLVR